MSAIFTKVVARAVQFLSENRETADLEEEPGVPEDVIHEEEAPLAETS